MSRDRIAHRRQTNGANPSALLVPIEQVIDLLHVTHAPERIEEYRDAIRRGERFPPISVIRLAGRYFIADGHKRLSAYKALSHSYVTVEVWTKRRWLGDQMRQLRGKTRQLLALVWRSRSDSAARRGAVRLFWDTIGHWRRIAASARDHLRQLRAR